MPFFRFCFPVSSGFLFSSFSSFFISSSFGFSSSFSFSFSSSTSLIPSGIIVTGTSFLPGLNISAFSSKGGALLSLFNSFISLLSKLSPLSSFISSSLGISSIFISLISRVSFLIESFGSEIPRTSSISTSFNSSISSFGLSSNFPYVSPIFGESSNFSFFLFIFFNTISKYPSIKFKPPAIVFTNLLYDSGGSFFPLSSIIAISFVIISLLSSCSSFGFNIFFPRNSLLCGFPSFISSSSSDSFFFFGNIFLNFISFSLLLLLS